MEPRLSPIRRAESRAGGRAGAWAASALLGLGALLLALGAGHGAALAQSGGQPGDFDYYVLSLSWQPSWCAAEGDRRGAATCRPGMERGFTLHGLWPQYLDGWPEFCARETRDPRRAETAAMADIMGSGGLAWHQWKKHGRCTGLPPERYFQLSRRAWDQVVRPQVLRDVDRALTVSPDVVEQAFLEANPGLPAEAIGVTCRDGRIAEVRLCLDRSLKPRACTGRAARVCSRPARLPPMR
ncbi:MAG: ribonuclease T2 [Pseudomonadota bacterium]